MLASLIVTALVFLPTDARIAYQAAASIVNDCTPRDAGTIRGGIAANRILDLASATGADVRRDVFTAKVGGVERNLTNLYAEFRNGDSNTEWVVLLSHYDTKAGINCPGANDGAATSGLLIGIANAFTRWDKPKGNLLMVWTDGEECFSDPNGGLWGSRRALAYIESKGYKIRAVVCIDMIGDKDLSITVPANGTPTLAKLAVHAARVAGYPGIVKPTDEILKDDHVPFLEKGYKAIDLIDFDYGPGNSYWHTAEDTMDKISEESLIKSGKVVAELLNIIL